MTEPDAEDKAPETMPETMVERAYEQLRSMAIAFELRPGDRLNEVALARKLGISRTPLREALNRLVADGYLIATPKQGFHRKPLSVTEISDLYELRRVVELGAIRLAAERAMPDALDEIDRFLDGSTANVPGRGLDDLVALDEGFHERIMALSGNAEMLRTLRNVNGRIRFVRWIDMDGRRDTTQGEHRAILNALRARDAETSLTLMQTHIARRQDQIVDTVGKSFARLYMR